MRGLDRAVDDWFDRHLRGRAPIDRLMYTASELGDFGLIWLLLGAAQGLRDDESFRRAVRLGVAMGAESVLVNGVIKSFFRRHRPVPDFDRPHRLRTPRTSSFPSGHASSAFTAATLLSDHEGALLVAAYYALAVVVASSRIHVKIHHASDVTAGALVGVVLGAAVRRLAPL